MADPVNDAPMTSYSDPFYDRIDAIYQSVKARWPIFLFVLILVVVITVIVGARMAHRPDAAGAHDYHTARQEPDKDKRRAALEKIATTSESQAFRVIALNDLVQEDLQRDDLAAARKHAEQAVELAKQGEDANLKLTTLNSLAVVQFQAGEYDKSAATYKSVIRPQPKFAAESLTAQLGQAQALVRAGKVDDALAVLDPLLSKSSAGAEELLNQARAYYWRLKREQAEAKLPKPATAPSPVKPVEAVKPAEPMKPVEPKPAVAAPTLVEPVKPVEPAKPVEPVKAPSAAPAADPAKDGALDKNPIGR